VLGLSYPIRPNWTIKSGTRSLMTGHAEAIDTAVDNVRYFPAGIADGPRAGDGSWDQLPPSPSGAINAVA
jgi:hypothetical protein